MEQYLGISAAILGSLGGAGVIVVGLSSWLGKVWATRLMDNERHKHERDLEALRASLKAQNDKQMTEISSDFEIFKQTHLREHNDKLAIYRAALDTIATILAKVELLVVGQRGELSTEEKEAFENDRLRIYGYLAMLAPQSVMDANDAFVDLLLGLIHDGDQTNWETVRNSALRLTNAMRADIGLNKEPVAYNGSR
ncbi:hypothetical protein [Spongiibacter tropicus]|uniref:hypothetical protein n=1 Tax=Spongiibacter tropicus TaxID=454602 RepID=UPI0003B53D8A|nr:hypothetical protein [Spongiibacter tropicus]